MEYEIRRADRPVVLDGDWAGATWASAATAEIVHFRPESGSHRPRAQARLLYDRGALHGLYRVEDRYVRCVQGGFQAPVCRDSCVEFFFQPQVGTGYFNFEFSGGGAFLCMYIRDHRRLEGGFADFTWVRPEEGRQVQVWHSLPERVEPELREPITWTLQFRLPWSVLEPYCGSLGGLAGQTWRGNFYKCGDETSQPHWASWNPVDELNFHLPRCFAPLRFA